MGGQLQSLQVPENLQLKKLPNLIEKFMDEKGGGKRIVRRTHFNRGNQGCGTPGLEAVPKVDSSTC